ncbi:MAG: hypothetical protein LBN07_01215 [Christensenellaceae bacterium]|jgi:hypothetical protein|nr:hypothetical protein [Christensenellaceae bacterium]
MFVDLVKQRFFKNLNECAANSPTAGRTYIYNGDCDINPFFMLSYIPIAIKAVLANEVAWMPIEYNIIKHI